MSIKVNKIYRLFRSKNEGKISLHSHSLNTYILKINSYQRIFLSEYSLLCYLERRI